MVLSALTTMRRMVAESSMTRHFIAASLRRRMAKIRLHPLGDVLPDLWGIVELAVQAPQDLLQPFRGERALRDGRPAVRLVDQRARGLRQLHAVGGRGLLRLRPAGGRRTLRR